MIDKKTGNFSCKSSKFYKLIAQKNFVKNFSWYFFCFQLNERLRAVVFGSMNALSS